jgi:hypothetical protein
MGLSETIMAAMIGALATAFTAMLQLMLQWRSATKPEKRAPGGLRSLLWMLALMVAAAVGGFAYAEYRAQNTRGEAAVLREDLQRELKALAESTARLEKLAPGAAGTQSTAEQRGLDGVVAVVSLPACKGAQVGFASERPACTEQDALQIALCTPLPGGAQVSAVELFARPEDSPLPWSEAHVSAGQDLRDGRFATGHFERSDPDGSNHICQSFSHWGSAARTVRMLVRYVP